jgi:hypothetical protein
VNVQGTGHNAAPLGTMEDTLLIRTSRMTGVEIDAAGLLVRVQAGALWQDVVLPAAEHGLAALHGSSPDVGVVGYSLGGGVGYMARRFGLQTNSVTAIELVTADGDVVRADADHEADLFWALRGGGGNFGVVTAMEFRLYPVESVYGGALVWSWEHSDAVFSRWAEWTRDLPDEITSMARILQVPDMPEAPEPLRGRCVAIVTAAFLGDDDAGAGLLQPLRELGPELDMFARMPAVALKDLHGDPDQPMPVVSDTLMLDELPQDAVDRFVASAGPESGSPLLLAELRHLGGAAGRSGEGHGALDRMRGEYLLFGGGPAFDPAMGAAMQDAATGLIEAMSPHGSGSRYLNFAEHRIDTRVAYSDESYRRLQAIRAAADPECVLRANHEIV